jgi:ribosome-associated protein
MPIKGEMIRLGQLLKLAGLIDSGSDAKTFLVVEQVSVNDEPESRRGRQLHVGDVVRVNEQSLHITN